MVTAEAPENALKLIDLAELYYLNKHLWIRNSLWLIVIDNLYPGTVLWFVFHFNFLGPLNKKRCFSN